MKTLIYHLVSLFLIFSGLFLCVLMLLGEYATTSQPMSPGPAHRCTEGYFVLSDDAHSNMKSSHWAEDMYRSRSIFGIAIPDAAPSAVSAPVSGGSATSEVTRGMGALRF